MERKPYIPEWFTLSATPKTAEKTGEPNDTVSTSYAQCERCQKQFVPHRNGKGRFCSIACSQTGMVGIPWSDERKAKIIPANTDKFGKKRAHNFIRHAIGAGRLNRPSRCELCGCECRPDACHVDYDRPHVVAFACRSCHLKSHRQPEVEAKIVALAKPRCEFPLRNYPKHIKRNSHAA